jgi:hypothetical protein
MRVFRTCLILAMAARCAVAAPHSNVDCGESLTATFWTSLDSEWERPPAFLKGNDALYAPVHLVRFADDGSFTMLACTVQSYQGKLRIMAGDGQAVFEGTWRVIDGNEIQVDYSLISATVKRLNVDYPTPSERHRLTCSGDHSRRVLRDSPFEFHPVEGVDEADFNSYIPKKK